MTVCSVARSFYLIYLLQCFLLVRAYVSFMCIYVYVFDRKYYEVSCLHFFVRIIFDCTCINCVRVALKYTLKIIFYISYIFLTPEILL